MTGFAPDHSTGDDRPSGFDEEWAEQYTHRYADRDNLDELVEFLLARGGTDGAYLDLCSGVGRIAIPLAARGVHVTGVDNAPAMLRVMTDRGRGLDVATVLEDCTTVEVGRTFSLAYITFNSLFQLDDNAAQEALLRTVVRHLSPGGRFVVEAFVPRPPAASAIVGPQASHVSGDRMETITRKWDVADQVLWVQRMIVTTPGDVRLRSLRFQYLTPAQLDAMAEAAGLVREAEYADWAGTPLHDDSDNRIAVYRLADEGAHR